MELDWFLVQNIAVLFFGARDSKYQFSGLKFICLFIHFSYQRCFLLCHFIQELKN